MLMKRIVVGIAGALLGLAAGGNAAMAQCGPGCDSPTNWSGFWLGAGVGGTYDMIDQSTVVHDSLSALSWTESFSDRGASGVLGTVGIGYDWQFRDRWIVGAFTDFDFSNSEHTYSGYAPAGDTTDFTFKHNTTWTIGARLGLATSNTSMVYGLIGYSQADLDVTLLTTDATPSTFSYSKELKYSGLTLGVGLEHDLGSGFSLKGEYRYTDYGNENFLDGTVLDAVRNEYETDDFDMDSHSVRLSLIYKFGRREAVQEVSYKDVPPAPAYPAPYK